jgi:hypothetical protein
VKKVVISSSGLGFMKVFLANVTYKAMWYLPAYQEKSVLRKLCKHGHVKYHLWLHDFSTPISRNFPHNFLLNPCCWCLSFF